MDYQMLKSSHRLQREVHHPSLAMGVYRALSWLNRAEQAEDVDGRVMFLWIAFNSTYATDVGEQHRLSEQESLNSFFAQALHLEQPKPAQQVGTAGDLIDAR